MVFLTPKPKRVLAACCNVDVINGAEGRLDVGLDSRLSTKYLAPFKSSNALSACALLTGLNALPSCLATNIRSAAFCSLVKSA